MGLLLDFRDKVTSQTLYGDLLSMDFLTTEETNK